MAQISLLEIGHGPPFHRFLQPRMIASLFVLAIVLTFDSADAYTRCTTSQDCVEPEYVEFCDTIVYACMLCEPECTGTLQMKGHCFNKCPERYKEVYEREGRDKPDDKEKWKDPPSPPTSGKTNESEGRNLILTVVIAVAVASVLILALVVVVALIRRHGQTGGASQNIPRLRARYQKVNGGIVTIEKGFDYQATKTGLPPDPLSSPQNVLCFGDVGQNFEDDDAPQGQPNHNIDVESVRSLNVNGRNSSQNSVSH